MDLFYQIVHFWGKRIAVLELLLLLFCHLQQKLRQKQHRPGMIAAAFRTVQQGDQSGKFIEKIHRIEYGDKGIFAQTAQQPALTPLLG